MNTEQIIKWNPDIIYIPAYADYTVQDVLNNKDWSNVKAVRDKKGIPVPVRAGSVGLSLCLVHAGPVLDCEQFAS